MRSKLGWSRRSGIIQLWVIRLRTINTNIFVVRIESTIWLCMHRARPYEIYHSPTPLDPCQCLHQRCGEVLWEEGEWSAGEETCHIEWGYQRLGLPNTLINTISVNQTKLEKMLFWAYWSSILWGCCQADFLRDDKYNKKIKKYHVDVDTDDEDCNEDVEREIKRSHKAMFYCHTI